MMRTTPELAPPSKFPRHTPSSTCWWRSPHWSSTGLTPFLGRPGQCGYFYATPMGGRLASTYDLACNRPHTQRIFSGIGFRTWSPPAPKPRLYRYATTALGAREKFIRMNKRAVTNQIKVKAN
ncbi:hypothetical protein AVEN_84073-1 [Araneus ventricosus]|uniref:Uncharacterized protein n=1 Tax=Araneus ventricosus TaxID=182803 RepID=A0A4Y2U0Y3_ARAVE|nr:hypothetical protein AVEN_99723-1 [Araneus ventricosus]GBO06548.1 hypothetical protein AVEN_218923-1 [Araneus ventricosus]GBO44825.1 hypothetical protein AVEN_84073-1 [Araneus ventricosus]